MKIKRNFQSFTLRKVLQNVTEEGAQVREQLDSNWEMTSTSTLCSSKTDSPTSSHCFQKLDDPVKVGAYSSMLEYKKS